MVGLESDSMQVKMLTEHRLGQPDIVHFPTLPRSFAIQIVRYSDQAVDIKLPYVLLLISISNMLFVGYFDPVHSFLYT